MSHPIYSRQQLGGKKLSKVKQIAAELGVVPSGNKTFLVSWIDAIVEHQAAQVQKIQAVEATIDFESESFEGSTQPYMVLVGGEIVHRAATYQLAERHCKWQGYILVDSQALAQNELEAELELQATARAEKAKSVKVLEQHKDEGFVKFVVVNHENGSHYTVTPAHPLPKERCECGDNHFRGAECKHQIAVKEEVASRISFISPSDFGFYEAILDGNVNNVIATIDHESPGIWRLEMNGIKQPFTSYQKAEDFIKEEYVKGVFMDERGSGRITPVIEDMAINIEDINFRDDKGQQYSVKVCGVLAGYIWLSDRGLWTLDGEDFEDDWRPVAKGLVKLTRHEYLVAA